MEKISPVLEVFRMRKIKNCDRVFASVRKMPDELKTRSTGKKAASDIRVGWKPFV